MRTHTMISKSKSKQAGGKKIFAAMLIMIAGIVSAQPQGQSGPVLLIHAPETVFYLQPVWSPDGSKIAFTSANYDGIWVAYADGSSIRLLSTDNGAGFGMAWSPDSESIVARPFTMENRRRFHSILQFRVQDRSRTIIEPASRGIQGTPAWLSDGSGIMFVKEGIPLIRPAENSTSEPAGKVFFHHNDKLYVFNPADNSNERIADFEGRMVFNLSASPEGNKAIFQVQGRGLFVINQDGTGLKELGNAERASWLPGEIHLVASITEDDGQTITDAYLIKIDITTGEHTRLTAGGEIMAMHPAVSPCGRWVVFDNPADGAIYKMELK